MGPVASRMSSVMEWSVVVLGTLMGGSLLICVLVFTVCRTLIPHVGAMNEVSSNNNSHESREVEMLVVRSSVEQPQTSSQHTASVPILNRDVDILPALIAQ